MASKVRRVIETLFQIYDKEGNLVDFKLNEIQAQFDAEIIEPIEKAKARYKRDGDEDALAGVLAVCRQSVLKYRQGGISTLILAWFLIECMNDYACVVMLTHDKEHSEKLLYRARIMLKNLKGPKPETSKLNEQEIAFSRTNSLFYIGTAGSKEFGRSATITHLHCSEIAFWKDPARLMKSLFQAVPKTGVIVHETTANGWGNWFQKSYYGYMSGIGGFVPRFYPFCIHEEYESVHPYTGREGAWDTSEWLNEKWHLYRLIKKLAPELTKDSICRKLQWRREKINENQGDQDRSTAIRDFQQEYPLTPEEAFVTSGGMLFSELSQVSHDQWVHEGPGVMRLKGHPQKGLTYSLGADFAGGTGNDNSSIVVQCMETRQQVYRYANKYINPVDFAALICRVGYEFNTAYLVPEYNNHGIAGVAIIKKKYPRLKIYKHVLPRGHISNSQLNVPSYGYGWKTSATTKPYLVGVGIQFIRHGYEVLDPQTYDELKSFAEDPDTGKIEGMGDHDDCAIAWLLSCIGILKLMRVKGINPDDIAEDIILSASEALDTLKDEEPASTKEIQHTHRDSSGRYLVNFNDIFTKNERGRRHHAV